MKKTLLLSLFLSTFAIPPVMAQEKEAPKEAKSPVAAAAPKKEVTPVNTWIAAENAMIDPLSDLDKESIFIMRNKYSIIRVIGVVERDISNAVNSCGKANPAMKAEVEDRFTQWKNAVQPITATAKKNLDAEITKQTIVKADEFKKVLKLNDAAFKYSDERTVKNPVSSPEACKSLVSSMDNTEDDMIKLLQDTLLPPSVIKSRVEKERKVENERKSFSKSAQ